MADWRKTLIEVLLADGRVDPTETSILSSAIMADGVVDDDEVGVLVELRRDATELCAEFSTLFFSALKSNVLADGDIDAREAKLLREVILADGKVDEDEKSFLVQLKAEAASLSPEFEALFEECMR